MGGPRFFSEGSGYGADLGVLAGRIGVDPPRRPFTGIKALMLAVLDNGIMCYLSDQPRLRTEAEHWVTAPRSRSLFSFAVVCEILGLEPDAVRAQLRRWRTSGEAPPAIGARHRPRARRPLPTPSAPAAGTTG